MEKRTLAPVCRIVSVCGLSCHPTCSLRVHLPAAILFTTTHDHTLLWSDPVYAHAAYSSMIHTSIRDKSARKDVTVSRAGPLRCCPPGPRHTTHILLFKIKVNTKKYRTLLRSYNYISPIPNRDSRPWMFNSHFSHHVYIQQDSGQGIFN